MTAPARAEVDASAEGPARPDQPRLHRTAPGRPIGGQRGFAVAPHRAGLCSVATFGGR